MMAGWFGLFRRMLGCWGAGDDVGGASGVRLACVGDVLLRGGVAWREGWILIGCTS